MHACVFVCVSTAQHSVRVGSSQPRPRASHLQPPKRQRMQLVHGAATQQAVMRDAPATHVASQVVQLQGWDIDTRHSAASYEAGCVPVVVPSRAARPAHSRLGSVEAHLLQEVTVDHGHLIEHQHVCCAVLGTPLQAEARQAQHGTRRSTTHQQPLSMGLLATRTGSLCTALMLLATKPRAFQGKDTRSTCLAPVPELLCQLNRVHVDVHDARPAAFRWIGQAGRARTGL
jgi:hypothetical protein